MCLLWLKAVRSENAAGLTTSCKEIYDDKFIGAETTVKSEIYLSISMFRLCICAEGATCSAHPPTHYSDEWEEEFRERVLARIWLGGCAGPHKRNKGTATVCTIAAQLSKESGRSTAAERVVTLQMAAPERNGTWEGKKEFLKLISCIYFTLFSFSRELQFVPLLYGNAVIPGSHPLPSRAWAGYYSKHSTSTCERNEGDNNHCSHFLPSGSTAWDFHPAHCSHSSAKDMRLWIWSLDRNYRSESCCRRLR